MWSSVKVNVPTPAVADLSSMMSEAISDSGMWAFTVSQPGQPSRPSKPRSWPRCPVTIWLMREVASLGTWISTSTMGSSSTGEHCGMPSVMAMRAAVLNAISELSTSWYEPSDRLTAKSTTGKPSGPWPIHSRTPCSTAGMYCFGTTPPVMVSVNRKPEPRGSGLLRIDDCIASSTGKSAAGSVIFTPPTALMNSAGTASDSLTYTLNF